MAFTGDKSTKSLLPQQAGIVNTSYLCAYFAA
jgi:hypothetical protein